MKKVLTAALFTAFFAPIAASAHENHDSFKEDVLNVLRDNPGIIEEVLAINAEKKAQEAIERRKQALPYAIDLATTTPLTPVLGNPDGDVTIIEFYDYNCGFCRRSSPVVKELLETDPNIKVVYREFPILSETSTLAARTSLAAFKQGKFEEFHEKVMNFKSPVSPVLLDKVADEIGLDREQLQADLKDPDIDAHISVSREIARIMEVTGTPSFLVGDKFIGGYLDLNGMKQAIAEQRSK